MSAQPALFAVPPSLADTSEITNAHEAYQRFLMAEGAGDAALLAWAKTWGRAVVVGLQEIHESARGAQELAAEVAADLLVNAKEIEALSDRLDDRAALLDASADRLKVIAREGARR